MRDEAGRGIADYNDDEEEKICRGIARVVFMILCLMNGFWGVVFGESGKVDDVFLQLQLSLSLISHFMFWLQREVGRRRPGRQAHTTSPLHCKQAPGHRSTDSTLMTMSCSTSCYASYYSPDRYSSISISLSLS
jgi:hypothetical protein